MFLRGLFLCAFKNKLKQTFSKTTRFRTAIPSFARLYLRSLVLTSFARFNFVRSFVRRFISSFVCEFVPSFISFFLHSFFQLTSFPSFLYFSLLYFIHFFHSQIFALKTYTFEFFRLTSNWCTKQKRRTNTQLIKAKSLSFLSLCQNL